jgi:hypothetical protein
VEAYLPLLREYAAFVKGHRIELLVYSSILIVFLWSASFSASIAEFRLRSPWFHFTAGLLIPVLYPIFILFKLPVYAPSMVNAVEEDEETTFPVDGPPPVEAAPLANGDVGAPATALIDANAVETPGACYDRQFFKRIAVDIEGNTRGPFMFVVKGNEFKVEKIFDPMEDAVIVEFMSSDDVLQKLRIPYQNIDSFRDLE